MRPGAAFACRGDGLCCTDVHALGPLSGREVETLRLISPEVVVHSGAVDADVLTVGADGRCLFLGAQGCALHAALGPAGKPHGCARFPFGLVATPTGGRITTDHRCPCRSMGDRPAITVEAAEQALRSGGRRLQPDRRVPRQVLVRPGEALPFEAWERREQRVLARLAEGDDPAAALESAPFPELRDASWAQVAIEMVDLGVEALAERGYESRFEAALGWFGEGVLALVEGEPSDRTERPWSDAFDRAEARSPEPRDPREVLADWVADDVWSLRWAARSTYAVLQAELGTRLEVARHMTRRLEEAGVRPDRAAAEAVTVAELVGTSDWWGEVIRRMRT